MAKKLHDTSLAAKYFWCFGVIRMWQQSMHCGSDAAGGCSEDLFICHCEWQGICIKTVITWCWLDIKYLPLLLKWWMVSFYTLWSSTLLCREVWRHTVQSSQSDVCCFPRHSSLHNTHVQNMYSLCISMCCNMSILIIENNIIKINHSSMCCDFWMYCLGFLSAQTA